MCSQDDDLFDWENMCLGWCTVHCIFLGYMMSEDTAQFLDVTSQDDLILKIVSSVCIELLSFAYDMVKTKTKAADHLSLISSLGKKVFRKLFSEVRISSDDQALAQSIDGFDDRLKNVLQIIDEGKPTVRNMYYIADSMSFLATEEFKHCWSDPGSGSGPEGNDEGNEIQAAPPAQVPESPEVVEPTPQRPDPHARGKRFRESGREETRALRMKMFDSTTGVRASYKPYYTAPASSRLHNLSRGLRQPAGRLLHEDSISLRANTQLPTNANAAKSEDNPGNRAIPVPDDAPPLPEWISTIQADSHIDEGDEEEEYVNFVAEVAQADADAYEQGTPEEKESNAGMKQLEADYQTFYGEILKWRIDYDDRSINNIVHGNVKWLSSYAQQNRDQILESSTMSREVIEYSTHWKSIMNMECRGQIYDALTQK